MYSSEFIKQAEEEIKEAIKDIWNSCKFKNYEPYKANLYPSMRMLRIAMSAMIDKATDGLLEADWLEYFYATRSIKFGHPTYWVEKELVESLKKTKIPMKLQWLDMELPYPVCTFVLPKGTFITSEGKEITHISYTRVEKGTREADYVRQRINIVDHGIFLVVCLYNTGEISHFSFTAKHDYPLDLSMLDELMQGIHTKVELHASKFEAVLTTEDSLFLRKAAHLIFGIIFLMKERPHYVEKAVLRKRVKSKSSDEIKEFWSSPVIGKDYKIRTKYDSKGGTHASPRFHCVPGFWNTFHVGVGRKEILNKWIEPYFRGIKEE